MSPTTARAPASQPRAPPTRRIDARISSNDRGFVQSTATPAPIRSAAIPRCRSEKARTRSGSRARIRSVRNVVKPPTRARSRAASGRRATPGTPTTRSPAPTMNAISVVSAVRQTMRRGNSTGLLPYIARSAPDARRHERHVDQRRAHDRALLGFERLAGARIDLVVGVVPRAAASLLAVRAEIDGGAHATGRVERLERARRSAVAKADDDAGLPARIPPEKHAVRLTVDERHFTRLRAARVPRLPRAGRLAIAILATRLDRAIGMAGHERSVENPRIRPLSLTPFLASAHARGDSSLRPWWADDRAIRARLAIGAPRERCSEGREGDARAGDARRRDHDPS